MKKQVVGMVLAGGRVDELSVLTAKRPKSALPVWGMYRIIDFVLSNMMHAGIEAVGVMSQYRPYSLMTHLKGGEAWDFIGRGRELRILSPYKGASDSDWYRGTADAVNQNLTFAWRHSPEVVLIASGDHVYSMDYRPMIRQHLQTGADLTMALKKVPREEAHLYGTAVVEDGRVVKYQEKARNAEGDLASLTVWAFNPGVLADRLRENAAEGKHFQIYSEVIPRMGKEGAKVHGYIFDGYWQYARTLDAYYAANMDILSDDPPDLDAWRVRTNLDIGTMGDPPPAIFRGTSQVSSSVVCAGTLLEGTVERSVISPGVVVERGAVVRDSVIMNHCRIGEGAVVDRAILDKNVWVGAGAQVGTGEAAPNRVCMRTLTCGVTVVGRDTTLPPGIVIGRNCIIHPDLVETDFVDAEIPSGATVIP